MEGRPATSAAVAYRLSACDLGRGAEDEERHAACGQGASSGAASSPGGGTTAGPHPRAQVGNASQEGPGSDSDQRAAKRPRLDTGDAAGMPVGALGPGPQTAEQTDGKAAAGNDMADVVRNGGGGCSVAAGGDGGDGTEDPGAPGLRGGAAILRSGAPNAAGTSPPVSRALPCTDLRMVEQPQQQQPRGQKQGQEREQGQQQEQHGTAAGQQERVRRVAVTVGPPLDPAGPTAPRLVFKPRMTSSVMYAAVGMVKCLLPADILEQAKADIIKVRMSDRGTDPNLTLKEYHVTVYARPSSRGAEAVPCRAALLPFCTATRNNVRWHLSRLQELLSHLPRLCEGSMRVVREVRQDHTVALVVEPEGRQDGGQGGESAGAAQEQGGRGVHGRAAAEGAGGAGTIKEEQDAGGRPDVRRRLLYGEDAGRSAGTPGQSGEGGGDETGPDTDDSDVFFVEERSAGAMGGDGQPPEVLAQAGGGGQGAGWGPGQAGDGYRGAAAARRRAGAEALRRMSTYADGESSNSGVDASSYRVEEGTEDADDDSSGSDDGAAGRTGATAACGCQFPDGPGYGRVHYNTIKLGMPTARHLWPDSFGGGDGAPRQMQVAVQVWAATGELEAAGGGEQGGAGADGADAGAWPSAPGQPQRALKCYPMYLRFSNRAQYLAGCPALIHDLGLTNDDSAMLTRLPDGRVLVERRALCASQRASGGHAVRHRRVAGPAAAQVAAARQSAGQVQAGANGSALAGRHREQQQGKEQGGLAGQDSRAGERRQGGATGSREPQAGTGQQQLQAGSVPMAEPPKDLAGSGPAPGLATAVCDRRMGTASIQLRNETLLWFLQVRDILPRTRVAMQAQQQGQGQEQAAGSGAGLLPTKALHRVWLFVRTGHERKRFLVNLRQKLGCSPALSCPDLVRAALGPDAGYGAAVQLLRCVGEGGVVDVELRLRPEQQGDDGLGAAAAAAGEGVPGQRGPGPAPVPEEQFGARRPGSGEAVGAWVQDQGGAGPLAVQGQLGGCAGPSEAEAEGQQGRQVARGAAHERLPARSEALRGLGQERGSVGEAPGWGQAGPKPPEGEGQEPSRTEPSGMSGLTAQLAAQGTAGCAASGAGGSQAAGQVHVGAGAGLQDEAGSWAGTARSAVLQQVQVGETPNDAGGDGAGTSAAVQPARTVHCLTQHLWMPVNGIDLGLQAPSLPQPQLSPGEAQPDEPSSLLPTHPPPVEQQALRTQQQVPLDLPSSPVQQQQVPPMHPQSQEERPMGQPEQLQAPPPGQRQMVAGTALAEGGQAAILTSALPPVGPGGAMEADVQARPGQQLGCVGPTAPEADGVGAVQGRNGAGPGFVQGDGPLGPGAAEQQEQGRAPPGLQRATSISQHEPLSPPAGPSQHPLVPTGQGPTACPAQQQVPRGCAARSKEASTTARRAAGAGGSDSLPPCQNSVPAAASNLLHLDPVVDGPARQRHQGSSGPPPLAAADAQAAAGPDDPWLLAIRDELDALADTRASLARAQAENRELRQQLQAAQELAERQARQLAEGEAERARLAQELRQEAEGAGRLRAEAEEYRGRYGRMVELLRQRGVRPRE